MFKDGSFAGGVCPFCGYDIPEAQRKTLRVNCMNAMCKKSHCGVCRLDWALSNHDECNASQTPLGLNEDAKHRQNKRKKDFCNTCGESRNCFGSHLLACACSVLKPALRMRAVRTLRDWGLRCGYVVAANG